MRFLLIILVVLISCNTKSSDTLFFDQVANEIIEAERVVNQINDTTLYNEKLESQRKIVSLMFSLQEARQSEAKLIIVSRELEQAKKDIDSLKLINDSLSINTTKSKNFNAFKKRRLEHF